MKKTITFLLVIIFIASNAGCSQKAPPAETSYQPALISIRPRVTESTPELTPAPTPAPTSEPKKFNFTASDFYKAITDINEFSLVYDYGDYLAESAVHLYSNSKRYICFSDLETNEIFAISIIFDYVYDYSKDYDFGKDVSSALRLYDQTLHINDLYDYLNTDEVNIGEVSEYHADGISYLFGRTQQGEDKGEYMIISLTGSAIDPKTLPHRIDRVPDFLTEYCDQVVDYYWSCDYKKLLDLVNSYIETQAPGEMDSAYLIRDAVTPVTDYASKCTVKYDKFTDDYYIYYKGVESVSKSVNFVPYLYNGILEVVIGFKASDWLFFDDYDIYTDQNKYVYGSVSEKQEKTLSNGNIEEYANDRLDDDEIQQILDSQEPIIRFESSKNDEHRDHELTKAERSALKAIFEIRNVHDKLRLLVRCWKYN